MAVSDLVTDARNYVQTVTAPADAALTQAIQAVQQAGFTQLTYNAPGLPTAPKLPTIGTAPALGDISLDLPAEPADTLVFQDITAIETGDTPAFDTAAPSFTLPAAPSALAQFAVGAPQIKTDLVFPEPPAQLLNPLIDAPTIPDRAAPTAPQVTLPVFDGVIPTDLPTPPTDLQGTFESSYKGVAPSMVAMMDGYVDSYIQQHNPNFAPAMVAIETQLQKYLDGGTALKPTVENAIYERARSKNAAEGRRVRNAAYRDIAARGFTLPPGSLLSASQQARQDTANLNAAGAREIVVMQAEMEQKNLQFAMTTSLDLRKTILASAISYHQNLVSINGQALDYAKNVLSAIIELYNTSVKAFSVRLDAERVRAAVYETRLKAVMAAVDLYRAEIAALEALTQVDRARVDIYKARIDSLQAFASVYRAQIEAVQGRASLEKLKLELFSSQVQSYSALVQAKDTEWRGFGAAVQGNVALAGLYAEQVRAFVARLEGFKSTIEAKAEVVRAQATTNSARAENFKAVISGYSAIVQARGEVARTKLENQRQEILAFQAEATAKVSLADAYNNYYRATSDVSIKNASLSIEAIVKSADLARDFSKSIAGLYSSNATIHGNLASAALAGMNTLVADTLSE